MTKGVTIIMSGAKPWRYASNWITLLVFIVVFIGLIIVLGELFTKPKTPTTAENIWNLLIAEGLEPQDVTDFYMKEGSSLVKGIGVQKDDLRFEFFTFSNANGAIDAYAKFRALIVQTRRSFPYAEHDTKSANYCIYSLKSEGIFNVSIYVGNTAVYAYCNEENSETISSILREIGYFNS